MKHYGIDGHLEGYARAYGSLADDDSRRVLLGRLTCYMTPFPLTGNPLKTDPSDYHYFDRKIIELTDREVFVDGGAYIGDTARQFLIDTSQHYFRTPAKIFVNF